MSWAEVLSHSEGVSRSVCYEESAGEFLVHLQVSENTCVLREAWPGESGRFCFNPSRRRLAVDAGKEGRGRVTPGPPGLRWVGDLFPAEAPVTSLLVPRLLCQWHCDEAPPQAFWRWAFPVATRGSHTSVIRHWERPHVCCWRPPSLWFCPDHPGTLTCPGLTA